MQEIPTKTRICLVRHGETAWNAERRLQGQIDIPLNETGLRQAVGAGQWLKTAGIVALYSSDLKRARMTAEAIGQAIGLSPILTPAMRERCYGIFEGLTYPEAQTKHPAAYAAFEGRNAHYNFENGESLVDLYVRVTGKLQDIAAQHQGQNVAVVLHGGVLDVINRFVRGNPLEVPRDFLIPNAGLNWVAAAGGLWAIESWGETAHLAAAALDELPS
jgi:probable phosphoglycerate mutase